MKTMTCHPSSRIFVAMMASLAWATTACTGGGLEDEIDERIESTTGNITFEEFLEQHVHREGGVYLYGGDMTATSMEELEQAYRRMYLGDSSLVVNQAYWEDDVWSYTDRHNLTYCVSDAFGWRKPQVVSGLAAATAAWEEYIDVDFIYLPQHDGSCDGTNGAVMFDVNPGWLAGFASARAFFPSDIRLFRNIIIDEVAYSAGDEAFRGILLHELGHSLGFRHEHIRPESACTFEGWGWRTLTPYDQSSIMHYGGDCGGTRGNKLSTSDIEGAALMYDSRKVYAYPKASSCGIMGPGTGLRMGQWLYSCDGRFGLTLQEDGNLVLYQGGTTPLWSTETWGQPTYTVNLQYDGNLVLYTGLPRVLWASNTQGHAGAYLRVQNDGNVVIYVGNVPIWATGTCCH
jgi:hypothetical protein